MRINTKLRIISILMSQLICLCHKKYPIRHFSKYEYITKNTYYITLNTNRISLGFKLFKKRIVNLLE